MIIYGRRMSRTGRCLWTLEELGLPYRQVPIDTQQGENRTAEFLALNPSGKVPVLDHDGFVMRESMAINTYLVLQGDTPLWPFGVQIRARIHQWSSWAATELDPPLSTIVHERRRAATAGGEPNAALLADCLTMAAKALTLLEDHLQSHDYLVGDGFSLADINACSMVMLTPMFLDLAAYPSTQQWVGRCTARAAWQRVETLP